MACVRPEAAGTLIRRARLAQPVQPLRRIDDHAVLAKILAPLLACAALLGIAPRLAAAAHGASGAGQSSKAAASSEASEGEVKFNTYCRMCHSWLKGDNRLGPSLYGVIGRKAGTASGYLAYSSSMKSSGWTWTAELIDKWITNPYKILPDTNMRPFPGVPDAATRKLIIAFLASHHDSD